jgi:riboflavin kinase / FMN adenylyltransferase
MMILQGPPEQWDAPTSSAVAIGVFDGVHRGHQRVIDALGEAGAEGKVALTFGTHPAQKLSEHGAPPILTPLRERIRLLGEAGVDIVAVLDFDDAMVETTPERFVERVLVDGLSAGLVAVGEDFRFGRGALGTPGSLADLGEIHGFEVVAVPILTVDGEEVRSTRIRDSIAAGDVETAARLLGRPHLIRGIVVPGEGRGATIGVPTANVSFPDGLAVPDQGVYAVYAEVDGARLPAVANLGVRPTFGGVAEVLEVHILDGEYALTGKEIGVAFVARLRSEQRFESVDELVAQIRRDIEAAGEHLGGVAQPS